MSDFEWPEPVAEVVPQRWTTGTPAGLHPLRACLSGVVPVGGDPIPVVMLGGGDTCPDCGRIVPLQTVDGFPVQSCRSCQAPIVWAETGAGETMPVNGPLDPEGNVTLGTRDGRIAAEVLTQNSLFEAVHGEGGGPRHTSHFATCPQAGAWRSKR